MSRPKVLITHPETPRVAIELLQKTCDVTVCEGLPAPTREEILTKSKGMDGILWATHSPLNAAALDAAGPQLRAVSLKSAGYDYADVAACKQRNVLLGNTPGVLSDAVADVAVGLMIAAARRFHEGRLAIETDQWNVISPKWLLGQDIKGSTVGIVGLGGIGQAIVRRLKGFEVGQFVYCGRGEKKEGTELGAKYVSFDELLAMSDFVIIACPLTKETTNLVNADALKKMKPTAVLVNVARGGIVDQPALVTALREGTIFAAGLDVMTPEPLSTDDVLLTLPNCVVVPHLGSATVQTRDTMAVLAAQNVLNALQVIAPHLGTATQNTEVAMAVLAAHNILSVLRGEGEDMLAPVFE